MNLAGKVTELWERSWLIWAERGLRRIPNSVRHQRQCQLPPFRRRLDPAVVVLTVPGNRLGVLDPQLDPSLVLLWSIFRPVETTVPGQQLGIFLLKEAQEEVVDVGAEVQHDEPMKRVASSAAARTVRSIGRRRPDCRGGKIKHCSDGTLIDVIQATEIGLLISARQASRH